MRNRDKYVTGITDWIHHLRLPLTLGNAEVGDMSRDKRLFPL